MGSFWTHLAANTNLILWTMLTIMGIVVEVSWPEAKPWPQKNSIAANIANAFAVSLMAFLVMPFVGAGTVFVVQKLGGGFFNLRTVLHNQTLYKIASVLIIIFMYDMFFYLWHRAEHRFLFLWHIHAVHHSDAYFNTTTYIRQHWLEAPLQQIFVSLPIAILLKFEPMDYSKAVFWLNVWAFFTHMNIRLDLGPLNKIVVGPQYHRIHHSTFKEHQDINFAQIFPIIDILFSTYHIPGNNEYPPTGLYSGEIPDKPAELFIWPFKKYWQHFKKDKNRIG